MVARLHWKTPKKKDTHYEICENCRSGISDLLRNYRCGYLVSRPLSLFEIAGLDLARFLARGRQCESDVRNRSGSCASIRAKATVVKSFLRVWTKFFSKRQVCASAKPMCKTDQLARAIIPATGSRVKSFLHECCKLFIIVQVSATGTIIVEN